MVRRRKHIETLYQGCDDLTDLETRQREISNLLKTGQRLNCQDLRLIAHTTQPVELGSSRIKLLDHYQFFHP